MAKLKKILVAYDGSSHSKHALNWALDLGLMTGAEVMAVKVFESTRLYPAMAETGGHGLKALLEEIHQEDQRLIDDVVAAGQKKGVTVKGEILQGNITEAILAYAKKNDIDMIAVGTKGHGALEDLLMGSVTRGLVSLAHIPVFVVKD